MAKSLYKRQFTVQISENGKTCTVAGLVVERFTKKTELGADFEYIYSLQEDLDKVLDLKINESLLFQPNRDDENSKAILTRTS